MFSTITSEYFSNMALETQKRTSEKLGFVPTINFIDRTFYLVVNEKEFVEITKPFFEDYYNQLFECYLTIRENIRRTSIKNLECRRSNNGGFPETLNLPSMDFDPFMWRTYLPQKFNYIVENNDFVFDSELGNFKIIREVSNTIFGDRIDEIQYLIKPV